MSIQDLCSSGHVQSKSSSSRDQKRHGSNSPCILCISRTSCCQCRCCLLQILRHNCLAYPLSDFATYHFCDKQCKTFPCLQRPMFRTSFSCLSVESFLKEVAYPYQLHQSIHDRRGAFWSAKPRLCFSAACSLPPSVPNIPPK